MPAMSNTRVQVTARAVVAGVATGLRSQATFPALARAARAGRFARAVPLPVGWLRSERLGRVIQASALGEMAIDKLPITPSRISPLPLMGRLAFGALAGGTIAREADAGWARGIALGAAGAFVGSFAGYWVRKTVVERSGLPDIAVALAEDAIAIGLASTIVDN
jgi:uncharacterized membrane protein